ncbi:MAG: hypothetical protein GC179_20710 [Anaerolineaceae bacterium]|nr:hypothetical protein [Anaerolineaceae bacterium]
MSTHDKKCELREHLALISTEAYLLMKASGEEERINRYNMVQEQIDAILRVIDESKPTQPSCPEALFQ